MLDIHTCTYTQKNVNRGLVTDLVKASLTMLLSFLQPLWQAVNRTSHICTTEDKEFAQVHLQALGKCYLILISCQHVAKLQWLWMSAMAKAGEASALLCNFLTQTFLQLPFFCKIFSCYVQSSLEKKKKKSIILQAYKYDSVSGMQSLQLDSNLFLPL